MPHIISAFSKITKLWNACWKPPSGMKKLRVFYLWKVILTWFYLKTMIGSLNKFGNFMLIITYQIAINFFMSINQMITVGLVNRMEET